MAVKKNCKSKCIFFDFLGENLEIAPKQGKNGVEVVKVITFIRGVYEINNFIESQLSYRFASTHLKRVIPWAYQPFFKCIFVLKLTGD